MREVSKTDDDAGVSEVLELQWAQLESSNEDIFTRVFHTQFMTEVKTRHDDAGVLEVLQCQ